MAIGVMLCSCRAKANVIHAHSGQQQGPALPGWDQAQHVVPPLRAAVGYQASICLCTWLLRMTERCLHGVLEITASSMQLVQLTSTFP